MDCWENDHADSRVTHDRDAYRHLGPMIDALKDELDFRTRAAKVGESGGIGAVAGCNNRYNTRMGGIEVARGNRKECPSSNGINRPFASSTGSEEV